MPKLLALNPLSSTDTIFFIVLAAIIALCIGFYFLIPVINKKQYQEMRDNLRKREVAFKSNVQRAEEASSAEDGHPEGEAAAEEPDSARSCDMTPDPADHEEK